MIIQFLIFFIYGIRIKIFNWKKRPTWKRIHRFAEYIWFIQGKESR